MLVVAKLARRAARTLEVVSGVADLPMTRVSEPRIQSPDAIDSRTNKRLHCDSFSRSLRSRPDREAGETDRHCHRRHL